MGVDAVRTRIESLKGLASPPVSLARILELASDPEAHLGKLSEAVESDPAVAARVLRLANSAYFGYPRQIESLDAALVVLGFRRVRDVAVCSALAPTFGRGGDVLDRESLWLHSCAVAEAARLLGERTGREAAMTFVAGLLHDVGKVALADAVPEPYARVVERESRHAESAIEAEQKILGVDHTWAGAVLLQRWQLPPSLVEAVRLHHDPAGDESGLASLVALADELAWLEGFPGPSGASQPEAPSRRLLGALGFADDDVDSLRAAMGERAESIEALCHASVET